jgi:hypothetical protein
MRFSASTSACLDPHRLEAFRRLFRLSAAFAPHIQSALSVSSAAGAPSHPSFPRRAARSASSRGSAEKASPDRKMRVIARARPSDKVRQTGERVESPGFARPAWASFRRR